MKVLRILLVVVFAGVCIALAYRQSQRWKIGTTSVLVVSKQTLFQGAPVQLGDVRVKKVLNDRIPPNALTNLNQAVNRQLAREKKRGDVFTAQDLKPLPPRRPPTQMNALIPEGRLLASLRINRDSIAVESLARGDRFDVVAMDGKGKPYVIARDAFYVGSLGGAQAAKPETQTILGQEVPPPPSADAPASPSVVLKLALWPQYVLPIASVNESGARISLILHGKSEKDSGEFLDIDPPKPPAPPVVVKELPAPPDPVEELRKDLRRIDPRIQIEQILVNDNVDEGKAGYLLTGSVTNMQRLEKAMLLTELFLGEPGSGIQPFRDAEGVSTQSSFVGNRGGGGNNIGGIGTLQPSVGAYLARGLIMSSGSGRVISFLKVDVLHQILVSIRVLEIDRNKADRKGIAYRVDGEHFSIGQHLFQELLPNNFGSAVGNITNQGNFAGNFVDSSVSVFAAIEYLEESGVARSVAEPNILTLSGELASVLVGGSVPIPSSSLRDAEVFNSFNFQQFGVELNIRPTLDEDNIVTLEVAPRIVDVDNALSIDGVPGFESQEVRTIARVEVGESLLLGGLLSYKESKSGRKVPFFGDIPLLGHLFRWNGRGFEEKELLFLITPVLADAQIAGLSRDIELPELDFRDAKLGDAPPPYGLNDEGLPLSWEEYYDYKDLKTLKENPEDPAEWQEPSAESNNPEVEEDIAPLLLWRETGEDPELPVEPMDPITRQLDDTWYDAIRVEEEPDDSQDLIPAKVN